MNAKKMIKQCEIATKKLRQLQGLLFYLLPKYNAAEFTLKSLEAVHELKHIAQYETEHRVTVTQSSHIQRILSKVDYYLTIIPDSAKNNGADHE